MDLRELRLKYDLTQDQTAEKLRVSRVTIARIEAGNVNVKVSFIEHMMREFSLTANEAFEILRNTRRQTKPANVGDFDDDEH